MRYQNYGTWYDTDKAPMIGVPYESGIGTDNYKYQALHRTRTGKYFLHIKGDAPEFANVKRKRRDEMIVLVSYAEADAWAQSHMTKEQYERCFGSKFLDGMVDHRVNVTMKLNQRKYENARRVADKKGILISDYIESLLPDVED